MGSVSCRRCDSTAEGLGATPLPGVPGEQVLQQTCRSCWDAWRGEQVKLINEYRLSPANPEHYAFLVEQMKGFLKLQGKKP
jgi:Fe-S cluster biosynthesis and repair protein YggX